MTEQCIRALRRPLLHQEKREINQLPSGALKAEKDTSPSVNGVLAASEPRRVPAVAHLAEPLCCVASVRAHREAALKTNR